MWAGSSKKKAVADALIRLGLHARAEAVAQALAEQGVGVNEALVTLVRLELLKKNTQPCGPLPRPVTRTAVRHRPQSHPRRGTHR
jgi:hypothetical protein